MTRIAEALIIAEITGSITDGEQRKLNSLRKISARVTALSKDMHLALDANIDEISNVKVTAEQIINKGKALKHREH